MSDSISTFALNYATDLDALRREFYGRSPSADASLDRLTAMFDALATTANAPSPHPGSRLDREVFYLSANGGTPRQVIGWGQLACLLGVTRESLHTMFTQGGGGFSRRRQGASIAVRRPRPREYVVGDVRGIESLAELLGGDPPAPFPTVQNNLASDRHNRETFYLAVDLLPERLRIIGWRDLSAILGLRISTLHTRFSTGRGVITRRVGHSTLSVSRPDPREYAAPGTATAPEAFAAARHVPRAA